MHEYLKHSNSRLKQRSHGDGGDGEGAFLNFKLRTPLFSTTLSVEIFHYYRFWNLLCIWRSLHSLAGTDTATFSFEIVKILFDTVLFVMWFKWEWKGKVFYEPLSQSHIVDLKFLITIYYEYWRYIRGCDQWYLCGYDWGWCFRDALLLKKR